MCLLTIVACFAFLTEWWRPRQEAGQFFLYIVFQSLRTRLTEFELPQVIDLDRNIMVEMTHYLVYYFSDF